MMTDRLPIRASLALALVAGCYQPELADCIVPCSSNEECGEGHVCADNVCRAPEATCEGMPDPDPQPREVGVRVVVDGEGMVVIENLGTCRLDDSGDDDRRETACDWRVTAGTRLVVEARGIEKPFERWTSTACAGQDASCSVVADGAIEIKARFR